MINIPVVLVLGAGASQPYGLPLGEDLVHDILNLPSPPQLLLSLSHINPVDEFPWFQDDLRRSSAASVACWISG